MDKIKHSAPDSVNNEVKKSPLKNTRKKLDELLAQTDIKAIDSEEMRRWEMMQAAGRELEI